MNTCICCSIFKSEIEALKKQGLFNCEAKYIPSMLHMNPTKLEELLIREITELNGKPCVLIFGDCCPAILNLSSLPNVIRPDSRNCCELVLGKGVYLTLLKDGAFFLMPEWVRRWREVFFSFMKLNQSVAQDLMGHLHKHFIYIDSGYSDIPFETLDEISDFFQIPWQIEKVDLNENFLKTLNSSINSKAMHLSDN